MSLYVRVLNSFWTHRKTMRLKAIIGEAAFWVPPKLWSYASENQPDGCFSDYSAEEIAMLIGYLKDAKVMLEALLQAGFLDANPLRIHDWVDHNAYHATYSVRAKKAAEVKWEKYKKEKETEKTVPESTLPDLSKHRSSIGQAEPSNASSIGQAEPSNASSIGQAEPSNASSIGQAEPSNASSIKASGSDPEIRWEQAQKWWEDWKKNGADYTESEVRGSLLALQANGWMWGRNKVTNHRAALERQIQTDRERKSHGGNRQDSGRRDQSNIQPVKGSAPNNGF